MPGYLVGSNSARQRTAICIIICGLIAAAGAPLAAQDANGPRPGVYMMDDDGANFRLVVKLDGKWNGSPSLSPDGKLLLFDASPIGNHWEQSHLYLMSADGADGDPADLGFGNTPVWSPDGKQIAFSVNKNNPDRAETGVWLLDPDKAERRWLCPGGAPRWCPDGKRLVLVHNTDGAHARVYLYDLEKNESVPVLTHNHQRINGAACSPDGKRVAFISSEDNGAELVIVPLEGPDRRAQVRLKGRIGWRPSWSADSKYVVCWIVGPKGQEQLHRIEIDTKREPELLAHQDEGRVNSDASWSADGKQLAFISDR